MTSFLIGDIFTYGSLGLLKAGFIDTDAATLPEALVDLLLTEASITDIIEDRMFPNVIPQAAAIPAITYQQISGPRDHVMAGATGLAQARFQLNCVDRTYAAAKSLFELARLILDGYSGLVGTVEISSIEISSEMDIPAVLPGVDRLSRYGKQMDLIIWYQESST